MHKSTPLLWIALLSMTAWPAAGQTGAGDEPIPAAETISVEEAIDQAEAALDAIPETSRAADRAKLLEQAKRLVAQIESADPANPWLYYLRGRLWAISGSRPVFDAISELNRFVDTHVGGSYWKAYVALGDLYAEAWPVQAKAKYKRADELNPNDPKTLYGLSVCAAKLGEKKEALDFAKRAVENAGSDVRVKYLRHLVNRHAIEREWDEAYRAALEARNLAEAERRSAPTAPEPLRRLDDQLDLVINSIKGLLTVKGNDPSLYIRLIEVIEEQADVRRELAAFEALEVAEVGVRNVGGSRTLDLDEKRVEILLYLGRRDDAVTLCRQLLTRSPTSPVCTDLLGDDTAGDGS